MSRMLATILAATALGGIAVPTLAQSSAGTPDNAEPNSAAPTAPVQGATPVPNARGTAAASTPADAAAANGPQEIVVTGTAFRQRTLDTPSPVTSVSAVQLQQRGITTAADAVLSTSSSSGGGLPNNFSGNGAFAGGATGVSLRGLTTDSTLVLQDGMRLAYYPFADDGARSFVDLNTIPSATIDSVQVLKDGASATYGADAIAGVVNYIMKKQITGVSGSAEGGVTQKGDAGHQRLTMTGGYGDLKSQGFNIYASVEYQHDSPVYNRDRGYPYNSADLSGITGDNGTSHGPNGNVNGTGFTGNTGGASTSAVVAPATLAVPGDLLSGSQVAGSNAMILNPAGCGTGTAFGSSNGDTYCTENLVSRYRIIQPSQTRLGGTARLTVNLTDRIQAFLTGTYYQNREVLPSYTGPASTTIRNPISLQGLVIPATLTNGQVNPQDPYANIIDPTTGQRESAILQYAFGGIPNVTTQTSRNYRVAGGVSGDFGEGWHFDVGGTYMRAQIDSRLYGNINVAALTDALANGSYNFVNPEQNSQAVLDAISPVIRAKATSKLWQVQGTLSKELFELPGGTLQLAVTGQVRYEDINDPSEVPQDTAGNYLFTGLNTFSAVGHRYNEAGGFELDVPILKQLDVTASGRYDHYSEGFSHFSPKVGVKITPVEPLILRGTFSKGFRAPSIPETQGSVIGFTTVTPPPSVVAEHNNNGYVQAQSLGLNTAGNPNLKPELSTGFTGGAVLEPVSWLHLSADFYHIKKKRVIVGGPDSSTALDAYYTGQPLPAGYTVTLNPADPAFPNATRTAAIVNSPYVNANSLVTSGVDASVNVNYRLSDSIRFISTFEGTWIQKYNIRTAAGVQRFAGTVGPYAITSASGTPRWRANWQNTIIANKLSLTAVAYYTSGYHGWADDSGAGTTHTCDSAVARADDGSSLRCHVKHFLDVDTTVSYAVTPRMSVYANVYNLFGVHAPFDPNTYGGVNYNPAWSSAGILGRTFRVGATFGF
jgi:iron complex outermembrane receptor protein